MKLESALKGMARHKEALLDTRGASTPSSISEHCHKLAQYIAAAEDRLADLEYDLEMNESKTFKQYVEDGNSANAAKELTRREFTKERATVVRVNRLVSSGWRLVSESQSRVKHLIAEANNQI